MSEPHLYSSDVEGGMPVRQRFSVAGRLGASYPDFVAERAAWLSLERAVHTSSPVRFEMTVSGPEALVGALEMACTLGPLDTIVDSVRIVDEPQK